MRSCERPRNKSASEALPSSVSNRYFLSMRTHGSSCRRRASSSLRRVSSFSALSSSNRAAVHSSRDTTLCSPVNVLFFTMVITFPFFAVVVFGQIKGNFRDPGGRGRFFQSTLAFAGACATPLLGGQGLGLR